MDSLLILPDELLKLLLDILDGDELINLCKSSKRLHRLCSNTGFWVDKIMAIQSMNLTDSSVSQLISIYRRITKFGKLYTSGNNVDGQLGVGDNKIRYTPTLVPNLLVSQVSCGSTHTAVVTPRGEIYTFGSNLYNQLGLHDVFQEKRTPTKIPGFNNVLQVSCGLHHTAFVTIEGYIYTFGSNSSGQLGLGDQYLRSTPTRIEGFNNIIQVSCGGYHTAMITNTEQLYVFGLNMRGSLGLNDTVIRDIPVLVPGFDNVEQVSCGFSHTAFVTNRGQVYVCGDNEDGQLGLGDTSPRFTPTPIRGLSPVIQVSCGLRNTIILTKDGYCYLAGDNSGALLGYKRVKFTSPTTIQQVSCGHDHFGFLTKSGSIYTFGVGSNGQLGLGHDKRETNPTKIPNMNAIQVSVGAYYTAIISK